MLPGPLQEVPAAANLLSLSRQQTSGMVAYAGRELVLARGDCIALGPSATDEPITDFIARSQRIPQSQLQTALTTVGAGAGSEWERRFIAALLAMRDVDGAKLCGLLRALYIERLSSSFQQPHGLPELCLPSPSQMGPEVVRFELLPLVLDSLSRIAALDDAQWISRDLDARLHWLKTPQMEAAQHWAAIGRLEDGPTVAAVLLRRPAAAAAISAVVRAGLARLQSSMVEAGHVKTLPPPAPTLAFTVATPARLGPGEGRLHVDPFEPRAAPPLPERDRDLVDPLRAIELQIQQDESSGTGGSTLAEHWLALSELWEQRLLSPTEAARALREAAAAQPYHTGVLQRTALACCRAGDHAVAKEYAQAAVIAAGSTEARLAALRTQVVLSLRLLDHQAAIEVLQSSADQGEAPTGLLIQLAQLMAASDHPDAAPALARAARALPTQPTVAAGLWAEATLRTTQVAVTVQGLASALADAGYPRSAVAMLWDTAELGMTGSARLPLLRQAVRIAQRTSQHMLATLLLLRAFDLSPEDAELAQALSNSLSLSGLDTAELIAIAQDIADSCAPKRRAYYLGLAGAIALQDASERDLGRRLLHLAIAEGDDSPASLHLLGEDAACAPPSAQARCDELEAKLLDELNHPQQAAIYAELSGLRHLQGDLRGTASAGLRCLALAPGHRGASARLLRVACRLGDPAILNEAFLYFIQSTKSHSRRSYALLSAGHLAFALGRPREAMEQALSALNLDPQHAGALFLLLRCQEVADPAALSAALSAAERALPDLPTVLYLRIQLAAKLQAHDQQAALLERWARCAPLDPRPRFQKLQLSLALDLVDPIVADARALLPLACSEAHLELICEACQRMASAGELRDAAVTLLDAMDHVGSRQSELAERALEFARLAVEPALLTRALERLFIAQQGPERCRTLWHLSTHHRHHLDHLAELRTQLRILAEAGFYTDVLERLFSLFARAGDRDRLHAVIQLALEHEEDPGRRERLWFLLATGHQRLAGDLTRACTALSAWLHEQAPSEQRLETAVGLLMGLSERPGDALRASVEFTAELNPNAAQRLSQRLLRTAQLQLQDLALACELCRLLVPRHPTCGPLLQLAEEITLARRDRESALFIYRQLEQGAAGSRTAHGLRYRAARWLERANRPGEALDELSAALALVPGPGPALTALERLAYSLNRPDALFTAYLRLTRSGNPYLRGLFLPKALQLGQRFALPDAAALNEDGNPADNPPP